ncbi:MAG TPA: ATP-dependent DNA helicase RecG [Longimicrobiales bacterium]|nr:ATP-dependent DNA helicase RecG [Longimicrobiales bacterium]
MSDRFSKLHSSVQYLKGVGPRRAEALERLGVRSARDLLFHVPHRYEDASTVTPIAEVKVGDDVTVVGHVKSKGVIPTRRGLRIFEATIRDASGSSIDISWPGQPFLDRTIQRGDLLLATGPVRYFHGLQIQPREFVVLGREDEEAEGGGAGRVLPIYPATEGLSQKMVRTIVEQNLEALIAALEVEEGEPIPTPLLEPLGLPPLPAALRLLHHPETLDEAESGRRRLAFGELLFLQLLHARAHRQATLERPGIAFRRTDELIAALYRRLPFQLTDAQQRALREILEDMTSPRRMNRLLQGDVGSGKTIVALFAMLLAVESGHQAALMAPTEILAEQHARTLRALLGDLPVGVELLTGRMPSAERRAAEARIASGEARLVVGTHALIQEGVRFARLGLAVIDEQHRFGVRQRLALAGQAEGDPDVLVMSATPIPRSLALTLHGDLDLSVLDERPPGRKPVRTQLRSEKHREAIYMFVANQVRLGRQAFIVFPIIEESETLDLRSATAEFEALRDGVLRDARVSLLHGQMPGDAKDRTMRSFAAREIDVLVATTVVEVGIDVPNASVMVIEHGERFGLSQLHQLRGRVGRGADESWCIVIGDGAPETLARLDVFTRTDDGFVIAEEDLRLRGMGDLFGARQHGLPAFRFFDPLCDLDLLTHARELARSIIEVDPGLARPEHEAMRTVLEARYGDRLKMFETG